MRARATQIQPLDGGAVAAPTRYRTHEQNLVESELSVVEALFGGLHVDLIWLGVQGPGYLVSEVLMRSRDDILHVQLQPAIRPLHLDVRRCRVAAVLGVVVGAPEILDSACVMFDRAGRNTPARLPAW